MRSHSRITTINGYDRSLVIFTGETCDDVESNHKIIRLSSLSKPGNLTDSIFKYSRLKIPDDFAARPHSSNIMDDRLHAHFQEIESYRVSVGIHVF
jgi:hypothetical protein